MYYLTSQQRSDKSSKARNNALIQTYEIQSYVLNTIMIFQFNKKLGTKVCV